MLTMKHHHQQQQVHGVDRGPKPTSSSTAGTVQGAGKGAVLWWALPTTQHIYAHARYAHIIYMCVRALR